MGRPQKYACIVLEFKGRALTILEWAKELGVPNNLLTKRYRLGWQIRDILNPERNPVGVKQRRCPGPTNL